MRKAESLFAAGFSIACLILPIAETIAQDVTWTRVGTPASARKITACVDGRVIALNADGSLWENRNRGRDASWRRIGELPRETRSIACAANTIYFLRPRAGTREVWRRTAMGGTELLGPARFAAELAGTEDMASGRPVLWAVNNDGSLWQSLTEGRDWRNMRGPSPASAGSKIAATVEPIFALNSDSTFWRSNSGGRPDTWRMLDRPASAMEIAATRTLIDPAVKLYALNRDFSLWEGLISTWKIKLINMKVRHRDERILEPYFVMVNFRSTFGVSGSTQVFLNRFRNERWTDGGIAAGVTKPIPTSMGEAVFRNVRLSTIDDLFACVLPEVLGSLVIAMESDASPWSQVEAFVGALERGVRDFLRRRIETFPLRDPPGDPAGRCVILTADFTAIRTAVEAAVADMERFVRERGAEILFAAFGDPDDSVGAHAFLLFAADPTYPLPLSSIPSRVGDIGVTVHPVTNAFSIPFEKRRVGYEVTVEIR